MQGVGQRCLRQGGVGEGAGRCCLAFVPAVRVPPRASLAQPQSVVRRAHQPLPNVQAPDDLRPVHCLPIHDSGETHSLDPSCCPPLPPPVGSLRCTWRTLPRGRPSWRSGTAGGRRG